MNKYKLILKEPINKEEHYKAIVMDLQEDGTFFDCVKQKGLEYITFYAHFKYESALKYLHDVCLWKFDNTNFEFIMLENNYWHEVKCF